MSRQHRYHAKPLFYCPSSESIYPVNCKPKDAIFFASTFEFEVYQQLLLLVGKQNLELQVPIKIKDKTDAYPAIYWRCDFRIRKPFSRGEYLNIEAKGIPTREFKRNIQYVELFSPNEFKQLLIIGGENSPARIDRRVQVWTLTMAVNYLAAQGYNIHLPNKV